MEDTPTYNGWTNYETWCVHLWLTNDQTTYNTCRLLAARSETDAPQCDQVRDAIWSVQQATTFLLADRLQQLVQAGSPLTGPATLYADLLDAAMSEVDWQEIAEAFLDPDST